MFYVKILGWRDIYITRYGGVGFQHYNKELAKKWRKVLNSNDSNILMCIHDACGKIKEDRTNEEKK